MDSIRLNTTATQTAQEGARGWKWKQNYICLKCVIRLKIWLFSFWQCGRHQCHKTKIMKKNIKKWKWRQGEGDKEKEMESNVNWNHLGFPCRILRSFCSFGRSSSFRSPIAFGDLVSGFLYFVSFHFIYIYSLF